MTNLSPRPPVVERGFPVLKLPIRGDMLLEGRQYYMSPVARAHVKEVWGVDAPKTVECVRKRQPATRITTVSENLETGEVRKTEIVQHAHDPIFRAFNGHRKIFKFSFSCELLHEEEAKYRGSHVAREIEEDEKAAGHREPGASRREKDEKRAKEIDNISIESLMQL